MAVALQQSIQIGKKTVHVKITEDGTLIVTCASKVKLRFPYEYKKDGNMKFTPDVEKTDDFLEVEASPNGTWDFEIVLCDSGTLLAQKLYALVVDAKPKESTVFAQDGIGDWSKQFAL